MAGEWIKMRKCLLTDPKIVRISSALKADRFRTVGGIYSAWCLLDSQTADGRLEGYTPEIFDELLGFPGLAKAMELVDWLEVGDGFLVVPRFHEHNGQTAKRRAQESVRKTSARDADKRAHSERKKCGPEKRREDSKSTHHHAGATPGEVEAIAKAYPRQTHFRDAAPEIVAAVRRCGSVAAVLAGTRAIAAAVSGWTDSEKLQFLKIPPLFFAGDHWRDDPAFWASKAPARKNGGKPVVVPDLGPRGANFDVLDLNS